MTESAASARPLEEGLRTGKDQGRRAFVPYVTGGLPGVDADLLRGLRDTGADAIEVGLPFSDPVMDGPVIQEAARRALEHGTTASHVLALVADAGLDVPVAIMTYLNPILAVGESRFAQAAAEAGVSGLIVPDLPVDEAGSWIEACDAAGVATVLLAAPNSTPDRLARIAAASRGFVYCVATLGVTGRREDLSSSARSVVAALRPLTDVPLLVGVGISTPEHAATACAFADGVVVGTALVEPMIRSDGGGRVETMRRAEAFRRATAPPA